MRQGPNTGHHPQTWPNKQASRDLDVLKLPLHFILLSFVGCWVSFIDL
jgi:hypothetical protein